MNKIIYKVYSDVMDVRQNTTSINLNKMPEINTWEYATRVLRNRFRNYTIKINHVGKTVKVEHKDE